MACSSSSSLLPCSSPSPSSHLHPKPFHSCSFRQLSCVGNGNSDLHLRAPLRNSPTSTRIFCLREGKGQIFASHSWQSLCKFLVLRIQHYILLVRVVRHKKKKHFALCCVIIQHRLFNPVCLCFMVQHRRRAANTVTGKSWDNLVLNSKSPVLVEFYASWCGPCQMVHRVIDEIAEDYKNKVQCLKLNTDHDQNIAEKYDIKAVPMVLIFKDGKKQDSIIGTMPKEFYMAAIDKALAA